MSNDSTIQRQVQVADILDRAAIAIRYAAAALKGLPHCTCGRHQWDGAVWISRDAVGEGFYDGVASVPNSEVVCVWCRCWCRAGGCVTC